jgi:hypothetical protein
MPYFTNRGITPLPVGGGGAYVGPGDIVGSALAWWGLRAYNAAYAAAHSPILDLDNNAGSVVTINCLSTGFLDVTTASALVGTHRVSKLYDQTGNGKHLTLPGGFVYSQLPTLDVSATPFLIFDQSGVGAGLASTSTLTQAQPLTMNCVSRRYQDVTTQQTIFGAIGTEPQIGYSSSANTAFIYAGVALVTLAATDAAFHSIQGVFDGASSTITVDATTGSPTTPGTGDFGAEIISFSGLSGAGGNYLREAGIWAGAFTGTQVTNMNSNMHDATNGWNF